MEPENKKKFASNASIILKMNDPVKIFFFFFWRVGHIRRRGVRYACHRLFIILYRHVLFFVLGDISRPLCAPPTVFF